MHLNYILCIWMLNRKVICLDRAAPNVCISSFRDEKGIDVRKIECCPDFYEEEEKCKPCKDGTYGKLCAETCLAGTYGVQCAKKCNCSLYEICHPVTGCLCNDFTGKNCDYKCPDGMYGQNCGLVCPCIRGVRCDSVTGKCICPPGFTGPSCLTRCEQGYFGKNCVHRCDCPEDSECDVSSGSCTCHEGFTGRLCKRACPHGFYGNDCSKECLCSSDYFCHPVTGTCECRYGKMCAIGTSEGNPHQTPIGGFTIIIVSSVTGSSVLIFLAIMMILFTRRRQSRTLHEQHQSDASTISVNHYDEINPYDVMPLEQVVGDTGRNQVAPPLPNVPRGQHRILVRNQDTEQNGTRPLLTRSLPNVNDDGTYLNPYCSMKPYYYEFRPYCVISSIDRSQGSGYLHPYVTLKQQTDKHQYSSIQVCKWRRRTY